MRGLAAALCAILAAGTLTGCSPSFLPQSQDIAYVELIRTLAIDGGRDDQLQVTLSSGVKRGVDGSPGKPLILTKAADTMFSACQLLQNSGSGHISYGHVTECVVGEQAAEAGIDPVLDYIQRDFELRMDTLIFLVNGAEAGTLVHKTAGKESAATDRLQEIGQALPLESEAWPCTVREFLVDLYDNGWSMMPVVELEKETDRYGLKSAGMALFHDARLVDKLDSRTGRGACLLLNQGEAGHLDVALRDGGVAGLKLTGMRCRWKAQWTGDTLTGLTAEVEVEADLTEIDGVMPSEEEAEIREMEEKLAAQITREAVSALEEVREHGDFLHLERTLIGQYPGRVRQIRANWDRWLEELTLRVQTRGIVRQSYDVSWGTQRF